MFSPNTDSFVFIRTTVIRRSFPVFPPVLLPNTHSFLLIQRSIIEPRLAPETENEVVIPQTVEFVESTDSINSPQADPEQGKISDQGRRNFLKVAGIASAGLVVSQLSPNKAHALIMGSSPTTGVVGVKNVANTRINPATEETLDEVLKTSDLNLTAGVLEVKVTSVSGEGSGSFSNAAGDAKSALVDVDRHVQVDVLSSSLPSSASTETTLQTISFGGKKYALRLATVGDIDYVGEADTGTAAASALWRAKKIDSTSGTIVTWADGNANFDNVATDLTALTYS